jgi:hypothetical protein
MSTSKFNKMQDFDEFQRIGKETPFEVPTGFFDTLAEKTLRKAITREHIHKKNNIRRLIFSVAASVAVLLYLGFLFKQDSAPLQGSTLIVERTKPTNQSETKFGRETPIHDNINELNMVMPGKINEKELKTQEKTELLRDVLSDLTDDDLQQMAIRYKSDAFLNESLQ